MRNIDRCDAARAGTCRRVGLRGLRERLRRARGLPVPDHGAVPDVRHHGRRHILDQDLRGLRAHRSHGSPTAGSRPASRHRAPAARSDDSAAAYCSGDDTIYISEQFASDVYNGALDQVLPGSSQGFGRTYGDFAVAYIVAHEYGHQIQDELGLFDQQIPTAALELQADCFAGAWANSAARGEPGRGRRRAGGARRRPRRRRLRHGEPRPPRHARAAPRGVAQRLRVRGPWPCAV